MTIMSNNIVNYVRSTNGNKIIIMMGDRQSFRLRQRDIIGKKNSLNFVSFKTMLKEVKKKKETKKEGISEILIGPIHFYSPAKL